MKWTSASPAGQCGRSTVGVDGGFLEFNSSGACSCGMNIVVYPRVVRHELGHAMGYYHTDHADDVMYGRPIASGTRDLLPSAREQRHARFAHAEMRSSGSREDARPRQSWRGDRFQEVSMHVPRLVLSLVVLSMMLIAPMSGANSVPFKGSWSGVTVSADPTNAPIIAIVAEGTGQLTHLGRYFMASPHTTDISNGKTIGDQIFTAANGDTLTAFCNGSPQFQPDGTVAGGLHCEITGGTGRFEGATGSARVLSRGEAASRPPGFRDGCGDQRGDFVLGLTRHKKHERRCRSRNSGSRQRRILHPLPCDCIRRVGHVSLLSGESNGGPGRGCKRNGESV